MTAEAIDALLAAVGDGGETGSGPVEFEGYEVGRRGDTYRFDTPEGTDDGLARDELRAALAEHRAVVQEWHYWTRVVPDTPHERAFCRWLERADDHDPATRRAAIDGGVTRTWGQLHISVTPVEAGRRTYDVRHVDDADARVQDLTIHSEPVDMREIARYDADGRYRPLSTAPTLRAGWAFVDLGPGALLEVVDRCYPATVANWHREREGDLDVTHWREAATRQTGIYDLVDELEGEAVSALARACCVDSQCLKRRAWDEDDPSEDGEPAPAGDGSGADGRLDVPRGDGAFPCREPCSLVVAAAREFVKTEREPLESVSLALRPRELRELRHLLDAAAEGDRAAVEPGELPDPANPLRLRYLRERLRDRDSPLASERD